MIMVGTIFDGYLNINILLIVASIIWVGLGFVTRALQLSNDHALKLRLLKALILTSFFFPVLVALFDHFFRQGGSEHAFSLSLSDLVVSQYLHGSLSVKAIELDNLLGIRSRWTEEFLALDNRYAMIAATLLAAGLVGGFVKLLISIFRLQSILDRCFSWRCFGNVRLLLSEYVTTPFSTRGLLFHTIVVPMEMLENGRDLRIALSHEFQHLRQRDTEWEAVLEFLFPLFFWNPAFIFLKHQIERWRELGCDQQVIARKGISVQDYCQCLLRTCESGVRHRAHRLRARPTVAFVQAEGSVSGMDAAAFLKYRMMTLIERQAVKKSRGLVFAAVVVPLLALVGLAAVMMQKPNDWSHERIMFSTIINLDRLAERNHQ